MATRLVLPHSPGSSAFLYNDELVFACSTGMGRSGLPEEKISFNSPGEERKTHDGSILQQSVVEFIQD